MTDPPGGGRHHRAGHSDGLHHCVGLFLVRNGRVLLAKRSATRQWYPGVWDIVGGHIEPGEGPIEALVREAREEIGIEVDPARANLLETVVAADVELAVYAVCDWSGVATNRATEEHELIDWFDADRVAELDLAHPDLARLAVTAATADR